MPADLPGVTPTAIVLGAAVWPGGVPSPTLSRRTAAAAKAFHAGRVGQIVVSGAVGQHPPSEARVMADELRRAGVPDDAILEEDAAHNTWDNIAKSLDLLPDDTPIVIVTDFYHQPRARVTARRLGHKAQSISPPLAGANLRTQLWGILREIPAFIVYCFRR